ncbi:serine/threonine-protein kinase 16 isoform X2 [Melospiza georgiana]|uniref:serine/threonine-protein kinase 16 isoform X2 n=1 Tax=Melospiza georgiana TaxID=44398 RepID=UPI0025ACE456|nr:serine/threonine-protein kinase 16 isoform X2 [Melospiza georgiana]
MPESWSVFEAAQDPELLRGLSLVTGAAADAGAAPPAPASHEKPAAASCEEKPHGVTEVPERMCCLTCGQVFGSREEQTEHYRLDWHRFNLKQRLLGRRTLPEEVFEEKTRTGDVSSISGSDSDSSDVSSESELLPSVSDTGQSPQIPRSHKVLLRNAKGQLISTYRCVLLTGKGDIEEPLELTASLQSLSASTCWVVLMMGGGHFAGAVFRGLQVQEHKTFHRYTVRARRGTAQSLRDAQTPGSAPRSAGASLRRYNEAALLKDIQDLLAAWAQHLSEAQRIFLRAPHHNRALLFGGRNPPLTRGDPRICHIPLSTRRATLREVLRVHAALASLQVYGKDTPLEEITGSPRKVWQKRQQKAEVDPPQEDATAPEEEEEESPAGELETVEETLGTLHLREFEVMPKRNRKRRKKRDKKVEKGPCAKETDGQPGLEDVTELQGEAEAGLLPWSNGGDPQTQLCDALFTACKTGDVQTLRHLLGVPENGGLPEHSEDGQTLDMARSLLNQPVDEQGCTLLHVAAQAGRAEAVCLLLEAGADPALRDRQERTPYCSSADRQTRNAFRKFMVAHPDKYDYSRAKVPGPLTQEMEAKKLEKKRAQKAQRKQREQAQRKEQQRQEQEQERKQWFAALSDREKRALAAERRLAAQLQDASTTPHNIRGFSYVDLVEGLRDGRFYALKRILCHDKEDRQAALHEVEMHGLFDHPNILRLVAHCMVEKGTKHEAWLLLPYVQGGTLWREVEALREKGSFMPEQRILLILHGICRGLQAIHSKGYAHRDLKPTNVLLDEDDQPVLMDLGSMNQARIEVNSSREAMAVQDWAAQRCTISYRAPELFTVPSQCVIDERTDIWSLGCVLYCMMFGEGPYDAIFQKGDSVALAVQNPLTLPSTTRYSAALQRLLFSMMTVNPQERPSINEIIHQLEGLQPAPAGQDTTQI